MPTISSMNPARTPRRIIAISIGLLSTLLLASCGSGVSTDQKATAQSADEGTKTIQAVSGSSTVLGTSKGRAPVINLSGPIPFQQSQLDASGTIADIDKVVGVIKNQYWVTNYLIQPDDILSELRKLPLLNVVAYRKSFGGYLIELDLENPAAVEQLRILQANLAFAVDARPYIGRALNKNFSRTPDDGSPSNDGANQPL